MRIFFATDLHGSEICFRKFCAAAAFYNCEALIMGGDVSGKLLVPIVLNGGECMHELGDLPHSFPMEELASETKRIANMGYYAVVGDEDLLEELADPQAYEERLLAEAAKRARGWVEYADSRLAGSGMSILFAPGNDDDPRVDEAFAGSKVFVNGEQKVTELGGIEVASTGWSNPTPWKTPRESPEDELEARLRALIAQLRAPAKAIFNFHVPPHGTTLDVCPKLDEEFRVVTMMGNPLQIHAGSTAVRAVIEEFQPPVSLHGHIHESRNATKLGRTLSVNPGSEYGEGVLLGAVVTIEKGKVKHTFTAG